MIRNKQPGFTIVELLIVIVVIGILAVVIMVAYNGISQRAEYTQIAAMVKQYQKAFMLFHADNDHYPVHTGSSMVGYCVGEGYPNYDGDPSGDCINDNDFDDFNFNENETFNDSLRPYMSQLPVVQSEGFFVGGHRYNGLNYMYDPNIQLDGVWAARSLLFYYLEGLNQDCQVPVARYVGSGTGVGDPSDYLFSTANPNPYSYVNGQATACVIVLP